MKGGEHRGPRQKAKAGEGREEGLRAIGPADHLRARLSSFQRKVERALDLIEQAGQHGPVGCAYSGGKDSTVLLDLVRRVYPDAPAALFDSGAELAGTLEMARHYGVEVIQPAMSIIEMCRYGGYWEYPDPVDPDAEFDFGEILIDEPARRFVHQHGLTVVAIGLRAQESTGRRMTAIHRGELYFAQHAGVWHLCPLMRWTTDEIWAYIASRGLAYNPAYDRMAQLGIPRDQWRVSVALGTDAAAHGRYVYLRQVDPDLYRRLAAMFPMIARYT